MDELTPSQDEPIVDTDTRSPLEQIEQLLRQPETATDTVDPVGDDETTELETAPTPEKVDYSVEIPMADGSKVKLGELKDFYQQQQQHVLDQVERENAALLKQEQAELLLSYVRDLPPHVAQAAQQQAQADFQQGLTRLNDLIPETKTGDGMKRVRDSIHDLVKEYGQSTRWADRIQDPIAIKMLNDYARLKASIKEARANVKPLRAESPRPAGKVAPVSKLDKAIEAAKRSRNPDDQARAVEILLRG